MKTLKLLGDERGAAAAIVALCLMVTLGFTGLVVDIGNMLIQKSKLQTALDAACLAGAVELPDSARAYGKAVEYAGLNGLDSSEYTVQVNNNTVSAVSTRNVKLFLMPLFGFNSSDVLASAAASGGAAHCFDYTLFSGSTTDTLTLNGNRLHVFGSAHTNEKFSANGNNLKVTGACEAVGAVTSNGNDIDITNRYPNSPFAEMPDYRDVVKRQAESAGQVFEGAKTYNGNNIYVDSSIYIKGKATLNGNTIYGAGAILTTGDIILNGNNLNAGTNDQVCLYAGKDITINGNNITIEGILYAPNGTITFNGNDITVNGRVIGNKLRFNGNGITIDGADCNVISLPNSGSRLIR